jgi:hypothetical protein
MHQEVSGTLLSASDRKTTHVCDDGVSDDAVDIRVPRAAERIIRVVWGIVRQNPIRGDV